VILEHAATPELPDAVSRTVSIGLSTWTGTKSPLASCSGVGVSLASSRLANLPSATSMRASARRRSRARSIRSLSRIARTRCSCRSSIDRSAEMRSSAAVSGSISLASL
jgi:hypothetical protein